MKKLDLNGTWQFKAINKYETLPKENRKATRWMNAEVPGTVHTDLMANRIIPDPFYRMNENDVRWVESQQWLYKRTFVVAPALLQEDSVQLVTEGLDTYAAIRINGKRVTETSNMFVAHRCDVKKFLRPGKNSIEILFDSPTVRSKALEKKHGALRVALEPHRVFVRKAQYSFSWDWGPKLTTSGIWRGISLQAFSWGRLKNPFAKVISVTKQEAVVELSVEVERFTDDALQLGAFVGGVNLFVEHTVKVNALPAGRQGNSAKLTLHILHPKLWWPNGYGEQPMYKAVLTLLKHGDEVDEIELEFAVRTVRLLQEKDKEGKSFIIEVNGVKMFCKGADWIPCDNFVPRIPDSTYDTLLTMAKNAHMNMIRVWGGGIYEQDVFYTLCDRLGLMVWQDFMYACGAYPEAAWFLKQAKDEAESVVHRLRNHPSIVVWCGNNECEWLFCTENPTKKPDDMSGAKIFRDILPAACTKYDGTRPYWRSSPFGDGFPNSEANGTHHQWFVWSDWKDYKLYENDNARFVAEFGFQAPANRRTFEEVTIAADRHPQSPVMEHHNKQVEGTERLVRFQAAHYKLATDFDEFIYKGQLVQAEALKCAVEHWRRRKFNTAGAMFWQLNDCWPVNSWAVIDSALRPKAGYYFAKKFFAPVLLTFKKVENTLEVWIANDLLKDVTGNLALNFSSLAGKRAWTKALAVHVKSNSSTKVYEIDLTSFARYDSMRHYFYGRLLTADDVDSEQRYFLHEPKHLHLPKAKVTWKIVGEKGGPFVLKLRATTFVKNVRLEIVGEDVAFDDNYFDMDAGIAKEVTFCSRQTLSQLKRHLRLRWL